MDYIGATPMQNPIMGLLAERLKKAQEFAAKPFGYSNPPAEILMNLLGVPAVQQTAERIAYGEPLTTGRGMTTQIRPEAVEAALTVAPTVGLLGKTAERGAMAAGRAGERYAEKVVPQIMERGGLPADLLSDLAQGTRRQIFVPATKDEAFKASKLLKTKTPQEVWQETGVGKFGGEYVKELSDSNAKLRDYQFTPKEAINNEMEKALISGEGTEKYKSMLPYSEMSKNELLGEYKSIGNQIIDAAQSGDIEKARKLQEGRSGLENMLGAMRSREYGPLSSFLSHGELNKAYPDIYQMHTRINPSEAGGAKGIYRPATSTVKEQMILGEKPMWSDNKSTILHEAQHAIQEREGWAKGGNADQFARELIKQRNSLNSRIDDLNQKMRSAVGTPEYEDLMNQRMSLVNELLERKLNDPVELMEKAQKQYESLAGEAQARLTQRRMNLTPEERLQYYPFEYGKENYGLDVKPEELIYRGLLD